MDNLMAFLEQNQFASGGFVLMVIGALATWARSVPRKVFAFVKRRLIFSTEVAFTDPAFVWLKVWLNGQNFFKKRRAYILDTRHAGEDADGRQGLLFVPAEGTYLLRHGGRFLMLDFEREELKNAVATPYGGKIVAHRETITLSCFGRQNNARAYIEKLLRDAEAMVEEQQLGMVSVHRPTTDYSEWTFSSLKKPRPAESLVLAEGLFEQITADVEEFRRSAPWYRDMGIPWKRGYLLYGPPGNGKSSLVLTIAGLFNMDLYVLDLSSPRVTDSDLNELINTVPEESIVVIEDIDAVWNARDKKEAGGITFSGLLNALDGVGSGEGRLMFMTTNHRERLDPALIRPGRADQHFALKNPSGEQIARMFARFFPARASAAGEFAELALLSEPSMATIQELLLGNRHSATQAMAAVAGLAAARPHADRPAAGTRIPLPAGRRKWIGQRPLRRYIAPRKSR